MIGLVTFLALLAVAFSNSDLSKKEFVGNYQYKLLQANEKTQSVQIYITNAAKYSADFAITDLFRFAGLYQEQSDTGEVLNPPCGSYQYISYSNKEKICLPNYRAAFSAFFKNALSSYLRSYLDANIFFVYDELQFKENLLKNKVRLLAEPTEDLNMYVYKKNLPDFKSYEGDLGTYGDEKIVPCKTGQCVVDIANDYLKLYSSNGLSLPYVWGGESPYPYADTVKLKSKKNSFFNQVSMDTYQPAPHQYELTVPGFDCSGWIWWVEKHANMSSFKTRLTADDYYRKARKTEKSICSFETEKCFSHVIFQKALPGDILFYGTPKKITHIMLYMGNGEIAHSSASKGLVKERLPSYYASDTSTNIVAVYRYTYPSKGYDSLKDYLSANEPDVSNIHATSNEKTNTKDTTKTKNNDKSDESVTETKNTIALLGPIELCDGSEKEPKGTYANRINEKAWNSQGKSYYELAVEAGLEKGIDPALLVTHMIYESSMGHNERCISNKNDPKKSSLTGCTWTGKCVSTCTCDSSATYSDKNQLLCTAKTDQNAYVEAVTGKDTVVGDYQDCNKFKDDPEKLWTCILCIYQGDYDHITKNTSGKKYFTRDGTCRYAENFKKKYCSWRTYFDKKGYKASSSSKPSKALSNSYIKFKPYVDTEITMNFDDLERVKEFVKTVTKECKDNLRVCILNKINTFNSQNDRVSISINKEKNAIARDLEDQMLDCYLNEQDDCICPIKINTSLSSLGLNDFLIRLTDDRDMFIGSENDLNNEFLSDDSKITKLPFYPTAILGDKESDSHHYVNILINKKDLSSSKFQPMSPTLSNNWNLGLNKNTQTNIALRKLDQTEIDWMQYTPEKINHQKECRDNKNNFRLQANFTFTKKTMNFALYLNDSTAPNIVLENLKQDECTSKPAVIISWTVPKDTDQSYDFMIGFDGEKEYYRSLDADAELINPSEKLKFAYQLYKKDKGDSYEYNYLIKELPSKKQLMINQTYSVYVIARDHYLNKKETIKKQIKIEPSEEEQALKGTPLEGVSSTMDTVNSLLSSDMCPDAYYTVVNFENNKISSVSEQGPVREDQLLDFDKTSNTLTLINLTPYPGAFNPLTKKQLYKIQDIPHITCQDDPSNRICATTAKIIGLLYKISSEVLVPKNEYMRINQAFRTFKIQNDLWEDSGENSSKVCNPNVHTGRKLCPHMLAGAIDITTTDANGKHIGYDAQERLMCDYGFVRYHRERWHFEYGTWQWEKAEKIRSTGQDYCRY